MIDPPNETLANHGRYTRTNLVPPAEVAAILREFGVPVPEEFLVYCGHGLSRFAAISRHQVIWLEAGSLNVVPLRSVQRAVPPRYLCTPGELAPRWGARESEQYPGTGEWPDRSICLVLKTGGRCCFPFEPGEPLGAAWKLLESLIEAEGLGDPPATSPASPLCP